MRIGNTHRNLVIAALVVIGVALSSTPAVAQVWQASADYSGAQGYRNWHYMFFKTSDSVYGPLVYGPTSYLPPGVESWHGIDELGLIGVDILADFQHPGGRGHEAARVWESPLAGTVRVTGTVAEWDSSPRDPAFPADGVRATIWKNGELLFSADIADSDFVGYSYDLSVHVMPGDWLIFRVAARANPFYDSTHFDPRIAVESLDGPSGGSWIASALSALSADVAALDLSLFPGPVNPARTAHRVSLAHELQVASNLVSSGEITGALQSLGNAIWRLDGNASPPDWMVESSEKAALRDDVVALFVLLRGY